MSDDDDDKPKEPLEPPANVPELRAEYDDQLFAYHQQMRAWRARRADQVTTRDTFDKAAAHAA